MTMHRLLHTVRWWDRTEELHYFNIIIHTPKQSHSQSNLSMRHFKFEYFGNVGGYELLNALISFSNHSDLLQLSKSFNISKEMKWHDQTVETWQCWLQVCDWLTNEPGWTIRADKLVVKRGHKVQRLINLNPNACASVTVLWTFKPEWTLSLLMNQVFLHTMIKWKCLESSQDKADAIIMETTAECLL